MLEANPDWRILLWITAIIITGMAFLTLWRIGGIPWIRHFSIPILLILTAVPWPTRMEQGMIQALTQNISAATVECMNWLGVSAILNGNVIHLANGSVGVNEACSGIRSFQTTLMISIFCGELYRLSIPLRLALIGLGLVWTILLNFCRTSILTWLAASKGGELQIAWHDRVGLAVLFVSVTGVFLITILFAKRNEPPDEETKTNSLSNVTPRFLPIPFVVGMVIWLVAIEGLNEAWFRSREHHKIAPVAWKVQWPQPAEGFKEQKLPEETRALLRSDLNETGVWSKSDGSEWTMFFLKWQPGRMAAQLARGHTPDVCMPASGFRMVAEGEPIVLSANQTDLPFTPYVFEANGKPWYVFFCLLEDRVSTHSSLKTARDEYLTQLNPSRRLRAVWEGKRFLGQQVFEIAMRGYSSMEQAQTALEQALPQLIQVNTL